MSDVELVVVRTFGNPQEADVAKSALEAAGIDAIIRADTGGQMQPSLAWAGGGVQVIVRADDVSAASEILDTPAEDGPRIP